MNNFDDEKIILKFFNEHPVVVEDGGFSRCVMRRLPNRAVRLSRLWSAFCAVLLVLVVAKIGVLPWLLGVFMETVDSLAANAGLVSTPMIQVFALASVATLLFGAACLRQLR